jgi:hypothetical protein
MFCTVCGLLQYNLCRHLKNSAVLLYPGLGHGSGSINVCSMDNIVYEHLSSLQIVRGVTDGKECEEMHVSATAGEDLRGAGGRSLFNYLDTVRV